MKKTSDRDYTPNDGVREVYDERGPSWWSGLFTLLLIPLLLIAGYFGYTRGWFNKLNPYNTNTNQGNQNNGGQVGVGGAPFTSPSPSPSQTVTPTADVSVTATVMPSATPSSSTRSNTQTGVGGGPGTNSLTPTSYPNGAPNTGFGGFK